MSGPTLREHLIFKGLTAREAEVAELVAQALQTKQVAERLFICEKTVRFHLTHIYKKLDFKTSRRQQLIRLCVTQGVQDEFFKKLEAQREHLAAIQTENAKLKQQLQKNTLPQGSSGIQ